MTVKELATELYTNEKTLLKWMNETGLPEVLYVNQNPKTANGELSEDGVNVIRDMHLRKTHPEIGKRFDNMIRVLFDQRKAIREKESVIDTLMKGEA